MKILKVKVFGNRHRKAKVVFFNKNNCNNIICDYHIDNDDLCNKILKDILAYKLEIEFDTIAFHRYFDTISDYYTITAKINYNGVNMFLELELDNCGNKKHGIDVRLYDPNNGNYIGYASDYKNIDSYFIYSIINSKNINYCLFNKTATKEEFEHYKEISDEWRWIRWKEF